MTSKDILIHLLSLITAIKDNNIEKTQNLVNIINENEESFREIGVSIFDIIDPYGLIVDGNMKANESLFYVIDNLNALSILADKMKFEINLTLLLATNDNFKIEAEINRLKDLMQNTELQTYEYVGLIKLANSVHDYDLLNEIRDKLLSSTNTEVN